MININKPSTTERIKLYKKERGIKKFLYPELIDKCLNDNFYSSIDQNGMIHPVINDVFMGDPFIYRSLKDRNRINIIGTAEGGAQKCFPKISYTKETGWIIREGIKIKSKINEVCWAPEIIEINNSHFVYFSIKRPESYVQDVYISELNENIVQIKKSDLIVENATDFHIATRGINEPVFSNLGYIQAFYSTNLPNGFGAKIEGIYLDPFNFKPVSNPIDALLPTAKWHQSFDKLWSIVEGAFYFNKFLVHSGGPWNGGMYGVGLAHPINENEDIVTEYVCDRDFPQLVYSVQGLFAPGHASIFKRQNGEVALVIGAKVSWDTTNHNRQVFVLPVGLVNGNMRVFMSHPQTFDLE